MTLVRGKICLKGPGCLHFLGCRDFGLEAHKVQQEVKIRRLLDLTVTAHAPHEQPGMACIEMASYSEMLGLSLLRSRKEKCRGT